MRKSSTLKCRFPLEVNSRGFFKISFSNPGLTDGTQTLKQQFSMFAYAHEKRLNTQVIPAWHQNLWSCLHRLHLLHKDALHCDWEKNKNKWKTLNINIMNYRSWVISPICIHKQSFFLCFLLSSINSVIKFLWFVLGLFVFILIISLHISHNLVLMDCYSKTSLLDKLFSFFVTSETWELQLFKYEVVLLNFIW